VQGGPKAPPVGLGCRAWFSLYYIAQRGLLQILALPITRIQGNVEYFISTAFLRLEAVCLAVSSAHCSFITLTWCYPVCTPASHLQSFINTANHKVTGLFVLPTAGTVTAANVKVGISRLLETCVIPTGEAMAVVKVCLFVLIRSSCLGLARAVAAAASAHDAISNTGTRSR